MKNHPSLFMIGVCFAGFLSVVTCTLLAPGTINKIEATPGVHALSRVALDFEKGALDEFTLPQLGIKAAGQALPDTIGIALGTHGQNDVQVKAELSAGSCHYRYEGLLQDNMLVKLARIESDCRLDSAGTTPRLTIKGSNLNRLSVWTLGDLQQPIWAGMYMTVGTTGHYIIGENEYFAERFTQFDSRLKKIAHLWQLTPFQAGAMAALALAMILAGTLWLQLGKASAVALMAFGITTIMALIIPPFQGPDEPDHFWGYLNHSQQQERRQEFRQLAKGVHFERLKFHAGERLSAADMVIADHQNLSNHVRPAGVEKRSLLTSALWSWVVPCLTRYTVSHQVLILRILGALIFSLVLGVLAIKPLGQFSLSFLTVPFLPFIAVAISNYSVLVTMFAILGVMAYRSFYSFSDAKHEVLFAAGYGALCALFICEARSVIPALGLSALIILSNRVSIPQPSKGRWFWFAWGAAFLGTTALISLMSSRAIEYKMFWIRRLRIEWLNSWPEVVGLLVVLIVVVQAAEWLGTKLNKLRFNKAPRFLNEAAWICILLSLAFSLVCPLPNVPDMQQDRSFANVSYCWEVLGTFVSWFRLSEIDFYLQSSYLAGFGWLQTIPSPLYMYGLIVVTPVMAVLVHTQAKPGRTLVGLALISLGVLVTLACYAYLSVTIKTNLHGRYLIGFNILAFVALCAFIDRLPFGIGKVLTRSVAARISSTAVLVSLLLLSYTYVNWYLLARYY